MEDKRKPGRPMGTKRPRGGAEEELAKILEKVAKERGGKSFLYKFVKRAFMILEDPNSKKLEIPIALAKKILPDKVENKEDKNVNIIIESKIPRPELVEYDDIGMIDIKPQGSG